MKRYTLHCITFVSFPDETVAFESDERGAAVAVAYQHIDRQCRVRLRDNHTEQDIEL